MGLIKTERLNIREFEVADAEFILKLVNDPAWIQNIGDRNIHTRQEAEVYLKDKIIASYEKFGFGLFVMEMLDTAEVIGMCGLVQRDYLPNPDIGFAVMPAFRNQGFASEAASAVIKYALAQLNVKKVVGITLHKNTGSIKTLEKLGMRFEKQLDDPQGKDLLSLYS